MDVGVESGVLVTPDGSSFASLDELVAHFRTAPLLPADPFLLTFVAPGR